MLDRNYRLIAVALCTLSAEDRRWMLARLGASRRPHLEAVIRSSPPGSASLSLDEVRALVQEVLQAEPSRPDGADSVAAMHMEYLSGMVPGWMRTTLLADERHLIDQGLRIDAIRAARECVRHAAERQQAA